MTKPNQRPEGALLEKAISLSGLSKREVARRAGLSEGRLRQIVSGYVSSGRGQYADVVAPPGRIAEIARILDVPPEALENAGRADAADLLRRGLLIAAAALGVFGLIALSMAANSRPNPFMGADEVARAAARRAFYALVKRRSRVRIP